jgi:hypothetical protein
MFANIRRHQKWLWYVISAAVIISFTWYLNPSNRQNRGGGLMESNVGNINGRPISRTEYLNTRKDAELKYLFSYGSWFGSDEFSRQNEGFLDREIHQRIFLNEKARELAIEVTPENIASWIRDAFGREKTFGEAEYNNLLKSLGQHGITEADLNRYARGEVATMHLAQVAGTPGRLVTPQEAETQYRRENQQVAADAVLFNASNYLAKVNLDPANITRHYSNQMQNFRVPEAVQVAYVEFPATNYFADADKVLTGVTNLSQIVDEQYRQRGTNYYTDASGQPMAPDAARVKIREDMRKELGVREARKAATAFAEELLAMPAPKKASHLEDVAQKKGLTVKTTEPFSQYEAPKGLEAPEKFNQQAFALTQDEPFIEEPVVGPEAVYVVALKGRIPSHVPPLAQIQDKVTDDYKRIESQRLAREAGQAFYAKLTAAMAGGKTFTAASSESGFPVTSLAPFSTVARTISGLDPRVDPSQVKNTAFALKEGETSQFITTRDGGFVLHVNKFIPASDADVKAALPAYIANLQKSGQSEAFNDWFAKEFQASKLSLVTDKRAGDKAGAPTSDAQ